MKIKKIISPNTVLIDSDNTIQAAAKRMTESDIDSMPVVVDNTISGIITEHDIADSIYNNGLDPKKTKVLDIMTEKLFVCGEDDRLEKVAKKMVRCQARSLVVMNRKRELVGIISFDELLEKLSMYQ